MRFLPSEQCHIFVLASVILTGCATTSVPNDQLNNFALVIPQDTYGHGATITEVDSGPGRSHVLQTAEGPNILPGVVTRRGANLSPGKHSIQVYTCHNSDTRSCSPDVYIFNAKPGLAYVLRGPRRNIDVLDRFQKKSLGYLHPIENNEFVSDQDFLNIQLAAQKKSASKAKAVIEQRQRDQALIRKIGARVCQDRGNGITNVGYVEKVTEEKVQIRIADAHYNGDSNIHPSGFSPSIIWDSPMQWDLCN